MPERPPLTVEQVTETIRRRLAGDAAGEAVEQAAAPPAVAERARELQRRFRESPIGGRLVALKRPVHWLVASAFDRQGKAVEAILDELEAESAERQRLARRVAELEARLAILEAERRGG